LYFPEPNCHGQALAPFDPEREILPLAFSLHGLFWLAQVDQASQFTVSSVLDANGCRNFSAGPLNGAPAFGVGILFTPPFSIHQ
jgi:hypothetical protein